MRGPGTWLALAILGIVVGGLILFEVRERLDARREKKPPPRS